jgi:hypothetical protein
MRLPFECALQYLLGFLKITQLAFATGEVVVKKRYGRHALNGIRKDDAGLPDRIFEPISSPLR